MHAEQGLVIDMNYNSIPSLASYYLEDSYILGLKIYGKCIEIYADLVLQDDHPSYLHPPKGDKYCYRAGRVVFEHVTKFSLSLATLRQTENLDLSVDFGNIDSMMISGDQVRVEGSWGVLDISSPNVEVILD